MSIPWLEISLYNYNFWFIPIQILLAVQPALMIKADNSDLQPLEDEFGLVRCIDFNCPDPIFRHTNQKLLRSLSLNFSSSLFYSLQSAGI